MTARSPNESYLLTPAGTGAIGVIRVSGPDACSIAGMAFRPSAGEPLSLGDSGRLRYGKLVDDEETLDDVMVSVHEDHGRLDVDITAHGGVRIIERILQTLERLGAPLVQGKPAANSCIPVQTQFESEAVDALARAKTKRAARFIAWQRQHLPRALETVAQNAESDPSGACAELTKMMDGFAGARVLLNGATIAIAGPPNAGKSTLFNCLIGRSAAIVSTLPGTTRDWISQAIEFEGVPLVLVDTPGRQVTTDELETEANSAARSVLSQAVLCLLALDGSQIVNGEEHARWANFEANHRCLLVSTKLDLGAVWDETSLPFDGPMSRRQSVRVSAKTGSGIDELCSTILSLLGVAGRVDNMPCLFSRRQVDAAGRALVAWQTGANSRKLDIRAEIMDG